MISPQSDVPPDASDGAKQETHGDLCDRYAAISEFEWPQFCQDEIRRVYPQRMAKASLDRMRKEGQQRAKERAKANAGGASEQQKPRPSDADMSAAIGAILDLEGISLNLKLDEFAASWSVPASAVRAEHRLQLERKREADAKANPDATGGKGQPLNLEPPEPWEHPVAEAALLDEVRKVFDDHLKMPEHCSVADALWVAHTYQFEVFDYTPRLSIQSPEMQCGKSKKLDILGELCCKAVPAANISAPAMFRTIELGRPTLLIDEADSFMNENEELRGIVNSGFAAGQGVIRTVGDDHEPRRFSTFAPVAIAGIGKRAATIEDRSIPTHMRRKLPSEKVNRFRPKDPAYPRMRRQLARMMQDMAREGVGGLDPEMPESLSDRQTDAWRPLFAIAQMAGGHWPELVKVAAVELCKAAADSTQSLGVRLLADIREIFFAGEKAPQYGIASKILAERLGAIEGAPWSEMPKTGKAITMNTLARMLDKYKISPGTVRLPKSETTFKGYRAEQFADAWVRYAPANRHTVTNGRNPPENEKSEPSHSPPCDTFDFPGDPQETADCYGVTVADGRNDPSETFGGFGGADGDPGAVPDEGRAAWGGVA